MCATVRGNPCRAHASSSSCGPMGSIAPCVDASLVLVAEPDLKKHTDQSIAFTLESAVEGWYVSDHDIPPAEGEVEDGDDADAADGEDGAAAGAQLVESPLREPSSCPWSLVKASIDIVQASMLIDIYSY